MKLLVKIAREMRRIGFRASLKSGFLALKSPSSLIHWLRQNTEPGSSAPELSNFYRAPKFDLSGHETKSILWLIPDAAQASGGHSTIFRFARGFAENGVRSDFLIVNPSPVVSPLTRQNDIRNWFKYDSGAVFYPDGLLPSYRAVIATEWRTAFWAKGLAAQIGCEGHYFVQDFEPWFFAPGGKAALAELTYSLGLKGIFAGNWLQEKLKMDFGMEGKSFQFSGEVDAEAEDRPALQNPSLKRIFFYARPPTERRAYDLGIMALEELARRLGDTFEVISAGWPIQATHSFRHIALGEVRPETLSWIYGNVDAGLVLSFTNVSLIPAQLMQNQVPVVSNPGYWLDWQLGEGRAFLAKDSSPESLADAIESALFNQGLRKKVIEAGHNYISKISWSKEIKAVLRDSGLAR
jgi:O-antigen biosynthesis protein